MNALIGQYSNHWQIISFIVQYTKMLMFQRMLLLWFDVLVGNRLFCRSLANLSSILCNETFFADFSSISCSEVFVMFIHLHNACFIANDRRNMKSMIEKKFYIRLFRFEWVWQKVKNSISIIEKMNDDETKFENCDRIFDVLKWANFNEFEWTSMNLNEHVSQCLNNELNCRNIWKMNIIFTRCDCKIKWLNRINEYIECEVLIFVAWWLTQCKNYWMSYRVYISK